MGGGGIDIDKKGIGAMKKKIETWKITWTGILIGIGILLPYVTAHLWGMKGTVFLPMHYSIFITSIFCGPVCGMIAAIATPVLSSEIGRAHV